MPSSIDHLPGWTELLGKTLKGVSETGPAIACQQFDEQRGEIWKALKVFQNLPNAGDTIAAPLVHATQGCIGMLPERTGGSFAYQEMIMRSLFIAAMQAQESEFFLRRLAGITDTREQVTPMTYRGSDRMEIGTLKQPGFAPALVQQWATTSSVELGNSINMTRLVMKLQGSDVQVASNASLKGETRQGLFSSVLIDHGSNGNDSLEHLSIGGKVCTINKKRLGIRERIIELVAWGKEYPRSVPVSLIRHLLADPSHDIFTFPNQLTAHLPKKT